jgi:hypothetical protein
MANKRWQPVARGSGGIGGSEMAKMAPTEERLQWEWRRRIWRKGNDDHVSKGGRMQGDNSVIGHGILAGKYLAEYRDSLK